MPLSFNADNINGTVCLKLSGELDAESRKKLEEMAAVLTGNGGMRCVIDLSGVIAADSIGYVGLLNFSRIIRQRGGVCGVCSMSRELFELVERSGGLHSLKIFTNPTTAAEALASLQVMPALSPSEEGENSTDAGTDAGAVTATENGRSRNTALAGQNDNRAPLPDPIGYDYRRILQKAAEHQARAARESSRSDTGSPKLPWPLSWLTPLVPLWKWHTLLAAATALMLITAPGEKGQAMTNLSYLCAGLVPLAALAGIFWKRGPEILTPLALITICLLQSLPYVQGHGEAWYKAGFKPTFSSYSTLSAADSKFPSSIPANGAAEGAPNGKSDSNPGILVAARLARWTYPSTAAVLCCWIYIAFRTIKSRAHSIVKILYSLLLVYGLLPMALAVNLPLQRVAGLSLFGFPTLMEPRILLAVLGAPAFGAGIILGWIKELLTEKENILPEEHQKLWERSISRVADIILSICLVILMVVPIIRG
ncbi:MAG: hypothetical protein CVV64_01095 [Candidatus Wallbacteria bacterium HGW-Wallbacteria-1]|jgi:anti-anti-sigma factor|uniref:STAS domain-containing protein n=1 Tax=Candidatus Wallbacteria bacterium HGW-Wallbacteria-1 TaxID=2013854 RepID=A0A2N1PUM0_9BACT|nr:MAG: hypothetical protein CVV64_01095 [Candidatus Wallbacteria bacterium HGW-Wallbacteria-1]